MPLLDHFHPPLSLQRLWEGIHSTWASTIATQLNQDQLPPDYFAMPLVTVSGQMQANKPDKWEVQVLQEQDEPKLRATIELVSPADKDRPDHRQAFAVKCAGHLQRGAGMVIVDVVTDRLGNPHADLTQVLGVKETRDWQSPTGLSAVAYRPISSRLEVWPEPLMLGRTLPTLSLWIAEDRCVPLHLEQSYVATCAALRIRT
jgi:hypothetical protein